MHTHCTLHLHLLAVVTIAYQALFQGPFKAVYMLSLLRNAVGVFVTYAWSNTDYLEV